MDYLQKIELEDLPTDQRAIAKLIGIENYRKLVESYGGNELRIFQKKTLVKVKRDEEIRASFTGKNVKELSRKYHLSDRAVREIIYTGLEHRKRERKNGISVSKV